MPKKVRFHPEAEKELQEAVSWYEHQRKGLGSEFFLCIDESISKLIDDPARYPIVHNNIRRVVVRRFPFAIFYELDEIEIRVIAIFHSRRDPDQWRTR